MEMNDWKMKYATIRGLNLNPKQLVVNIYDQFKDLPTNSTPYYRLPYKFIEYQVGSYGGFIRYRIEIDSTPFQKEDPDIILKVQFR